MTNNQQSHPHPDPEVQKTVSAPVHEKVLAVVGVSDDSEKYGHKVFMNLIERGYRVYPIHPSGGAIAGHERYKTLRELPTTPDIVVTVVPSKVTEDIAKECVELGVHTLWMQPGSESETAIAYVREHNMQAISNACIMLT